MAYSFSLRAHAQALYLAAATVFALRKGDFTLPERVEGEYLGPTLIAADSAR